MIRLEFDTHVKSLEDNVEIIDEKQFKIGIDKIWL